MSSKADQPEILGMRLSLYEPPAPDRNRARWRINGFSASILIWTQEEWDQLPDPPEDAQYYSCGVWCALRLDD